VRGTMPWSGLIGHRRRAARRVTRDMLAEYRKQRRDRPLAGPDLPARLGLQRPARKAPSSRASTMAKPSHMTTRALSTRPGFEPGTFGSFAVHHETAAARRPAHAHADPRLRARLANFCLLNAQLSTPFAVLLGILSWQPKRTTVYSTYPPCLLSESDSICDGLQ
jgi:hypothetical protein